MTTVLRIAFPEALGRIHLATTHAQMRALAAFAAQLADDLGFGRVLVQEACELWARGRRCAACSHHRSSHEHDGDCWSVACGCPAYLSGDDQ
jgi:hypothetical protein